MPIPTAATGRLQFDCRRCNHQRHATICGRCKQPKKGHICICNEGDEQTPLITSGSRLLGAPGPGGAPNGPGGAPNGSAAPTGAYGISYGISMVSLWYLYGISMASP